MFTHGVCSGDPIADGFVIWTRFVPDADAATVRWEVATDAAFTDVVDEGESTTDGGCDFTVRHDVRGLAADTEHHYRFHADGQTSVTGLARTLPDGHPERLRFAIVSCAFYRGGWFNVYGRLAERDDLAFVAHLGDYIYEFPNDMPNYKPWNLAEDRMMDPDGECFTLEDYRRRYACVRSDPDLQALHRRYAFIHQWDDHEIVNDAFVNGSPKEAQAPLPFLERKAGAMRAFWEWMPVRWPVPGTTMSTPEETDHPRLYRTFAIGDLVDLFCIDTRHEGRDPIPDGAMTDEQYLDPDRSMMSATQRAWLRGQVSESTARWRFLANQAILGHLVVQDLPEKVTRSLSKISYPVGGGRSTNGGQWEGFAAERARLFTWLRDHRIDNLVVLTGDIHSSWAFDLERDDGLPSVGVEIVTPSISTRSIGDQVETRPDDARELEALIRDQHPWISYVDLDGHGYVVLDVDQDRVEATWWRIDEVLTRNEHQLQGPTYRVRHGTNHLELVSEGPA